MVRRTLRGMRHLLGALVLLTGLVCLAEVLLSARRAAMLADARAETVEDLAVPSRTTYRELRPLAETPSEAGVTLRTNSFGLRGAEPKLPKPDGVLRVLVLGDERTLAAATDRSQTFCAVAETLLKDRTRLPVEILNGGLPGGCPLTLTLACRHRLASLRPDAVVVMLDAGDVTDDLRCRPYVRQDADGGPLACPHPSLGGRRSSADAWRSEFRLIDLGGRFLVDRWVDHAPPVRGDLLSDARQKEWLTAPVGVWSGPLEAALAPLQTLRVDFSERPVVAIIVPETSGPASGWQEAARLLAAHGVRTVDPSGTFAQMGPQAALFRDTPLHGDRLSARGHQRMGFELAAVIAQFPGVR